ncbi:MAG: hypothetical protein A2293_04575 [Elusimicrobia bacterium RIFOXYB2_FULL_49_7]|nr:MAG: hypothetical protein A2293_04575 [Elusimicrobia bacterium RIFOXYB2_FULL_49_7]
MKIVQSYLLCFCLFVLSMPVISQELSTGVRTDTLSQVGSEIIFNIAIGFLTGGDQHETGLSPAPDNLSKTLVGLSYQYYWNQFGVEFDYDFYGGTSSQKQGYKPLMLYNEMVLRLGINAAPVVRATPFLLWRIVFGAGLCYDFFKMDDEYKDLFPANTPFYSGWATGLGFYGKGMAEWVFSGRFMFGMGLQYESVNPKFEDAPEGASGTSFLIPMRIGYKF